MHKVYKAQQNLQRQQREISKILKKKSQVTTYDQTYVSWEKAKRIDGKRDSNRPIILSKTWRPKKPERRFGMQTYCLVFLLISLL